MRVSRRLSLVQTFQSNWFKGDEVRVFRVETDCSARTKEIRMLQFFKRLGTPIKESIASPTLLVIATEVHESLSL